MTETVAGSGIFLGHFRMYSRLLMPESHLLSIILIRKSHDRRAWRRAVLGGYAEAADEVVDL